MEPRGREAETDFTKRGVTFEVGGASAPRRPQGRLTIIGLLVKLEPKAAEQAAPSETLSDDDNEIVADFLRRHQQVIP